MCNALPLSQSIIVNISQNGTQLYAKLRNKQNNVNKFSSFTFTGSICLLDIEEHTYLQITFKMWTLEPNLLIVELKSS